MFVNYICTTSNSVVRQALKANFKAPSKLVYATLVDQSYSYARPQLAIAASSNCTIGSTSVQILPKPKKNDTMCAVDLDYIAGADSPSHAQ